MIIAVVVPLEANAKKSDKGSEGFKPHALGAAEL